MNTEHGLLFWLFLLQVLVSRYLVGADGVHSKVRKTLSIPFEGFSVDEPLHFIEGRGHCPFIFRSGFVILAKSKRCMFTLYEGTSTLIIYQFVYIILLVKLSLLLKLVVVPVITTVTTYLYGKVSLKNKSGIHY